MLLHMKSSTREKFGDFFTLIEYGCLSFSSLNGFDFDFFFFLAGALVGLVDTDLFHFAFSATAATDTDANRRQTYS